MLEFPFVALLGAAQLQRALVLLAVDPAIGGLLITGTRGTAKSTAARALAALLPTIDVVEGDLYNRSMVGTVEADTTIPTPFVELPVGVSEDRVIGALDTRALLERQERFKPGLLARANRGILYIDEVNLLPDHVVDVVLDAAATGTNVVERDGLSFVHDARFMLIGTMNPEEGELRPQLLDRFGLCVESVNEEDLDQRIQIVRRRLAFEADRAAFVKAYQAQTQALQQRILQARLLAPMLTFEDDILRRASELALEAGVEGMRADLTIVRTARAIAALEGRPRIIAADVDAAATLALAHRRRENTPPPGPSGRSSPPPPSSPPPTTPPPSSPPTLAPPPSSPASQASPGVDLPPSTPQPVSSPSEEAASWSAEAAAGSPSDALASVPPLPLAAVGAPTDLNLQRARRRRNAPRGARRVGAAVGSRLAAAATILAAVAEQPSQLMIEERHLRYTVHVQREQRLVILLVDASGSMAAAARMRAAKGVVCSLLEDAYRRRDSVSLVAFHGQGAQILVPPTRSPALAYRRLASLPIGGKTPLARGLYQARRLALQNIRRNPNLCSYVVVISDARANVPEVGAFASALEEAKRLRKSGAQALCIDTESGRVRLRLAQQLAAQLGATYRHIEQCTERNISATIREWMLAA